MFKARMQECCIGNVEAYLIDVDIELWYQQVSHANITQADKSRVHYPIIVPIKLLTTPQGRVYFWWVHTRLHCCWLLNTKKRWPWFVMSCTCASPSEVASQRKIAYTLLQSVLVSSAVFSKVQGVTMKSQAVRYTVLMTTRYVTLLLQDCHQFTYYLDTCRSLMFIRIVTPLASLEK